MTAPDDKPMRVIDLFEALRKSLTEHAAQAPAPEPEPPRSEDALPCPGCGRPMARVGGPGAHRGWTCVNCNAAGDAELDHPDPDDDRPCSCEEALALRERVRELEAELDGERTSRIEMNNAALQAEARVRELEAELELRKAEHTAANDELRRRALAKSGLHVVSEADKRVLDACSRLDLRARTDGLVTCYGGLRGVELAEFGRRGEKP